jgi:hypothetical protein
MTCEVCNKARFFVGLALPPLPLQLVLLSLRCGKEPAKLFLDSAVSLSDIVGDGSWQRGRLGTAARLAGGESGTAESQARIPVSCISVKWYRERAIGPRVVDAPSWIQAVLYGRGILPLPAVAVATTRD